MRNVQTILLFSCMHPRCNIADVHSADELGSTPADGVRCNCTVPPRSVHLRTVPRQLLLVRGTAARRTTATGPRYSCWSHNSCWSEIQLMVGGTSVHRYYKSWSMPDTGHATLPLQNYNSLGCESLTRSHPKSKSVDGLCYVLEPGPALVFSTFDSSQTESSESASFSGSSDSTNLSDILSEEIVIGHHQNLSNTIVKSLSSKALAVDHLETTTTPPGALDASVSFGDPVSEREIRTPANGRWLLSQILVAVSVSIGSFLVGFTSAYTSPALESMKQQNSTLQLTHSEASWVGSAMPLSAMAGALMSGGLIERFGRRRVLGWMGLPFLVSYLLVAGASSVTMLYVARALAGVAVGVLSLAMPIYLGETIHATIRGTLGLFPTTIGNSGILLCFLFGWFLRWDHLALFAAVFPLIFVGLMWFLPESPHWCIAQGRKAEAAASLQWLRGGRPGQERAAADAEMRALLTHFRRHRSGQPSWKLLLSRQHLRPLIISLTLMFFQQMSGINAVIFYARNIFSFSGNSVDSDVSSIIIGLVNLLSTLLANWLVDRLGRKPLLYTSSALMTGSLALLGTYFYLLTTDPGKSSPLLQFGWLPLVSFMVFVFAFSLGWGPIPWLFLGEGLPGHLRGLIGSLAATFNWVCTFIVTKLFGDMVHYMGAHGTFWLFGTLMACSIVVVYFFVPETKGKTLEHIERDLYNSSLPPNS